MGARSYNRPLTDAGDRRRRRIVGAASLLLAGLVAMAAGGGATIGLAYFRRVSAQESPTVLKVVAIAGFTTSVKSTFAPLGSGLVKWRADWSLCWDRTPNAIGYDITVLTSEGISPRLRRQTTTCLVVEVAAGEHPPDRIEREQGIQMSIQRSQLSYRVRAALPNSQVGEWSREVSAGEDLSDPPR
ncbi:MAG: hypothetical protein EXR45_02230 [Chloroflexi bacterium]|nr:hypothetical protein [Chloroflexota bacterium]